MNSTRKTPDGQRRQNNTVRFVRTREGERRYGKPIGSVIVSDTDMENIKHLGNHKGWGVFRGKNGKKYQVGKVDGLWVATPFGDFTRRRSLVEGGDLQATLKALNRRAGNKAERREDTQYDRQKRAGKRGTVTGRPTAKEKAPTKRKRGTTTSSKRSTSRSSRGAGSKTPVKKITKKKGDYTGANLQGLRRLVSAAFGTASSGAERSAASKVMAELEKQGLVKRTRVKGKIQWRPVDGYSASDVVAGATESEKIDSIMFELQKSEEKAMQVAERIEHRANVMFAELKGLTIHDGSVESLEQKDMQEGMEEKVRRVRTPAGVRRFKKPIGSIIGRGGKVFQNITIEKPVFDGWDLVKDKKGKKYDVGREGGKWQAYGHNDWDDLVAEADSEDDLFEALDRKAGGGAKKPSAEHQRSASNTGRPTLTAKQEEEVGALSEVGQRRYWDSRTSAVGKANHATAMRNAKATDRTVGKRLAAIRKKPRSEWTDKDILDIVGSDARDVPLKLNNAQQKKYFAAYRDGNDHAESMKIAKGRGAYKPKAQRNDDDDPTFRRIQADRDREADEEEQERLARRRAGVRPKTRAEGRAKARAERIANERHGANKPKADRTDEEIIEGLNNAFRKQFDTLSSSQKRKYTQAFREGKTHGEAMARARGGSASTQKAKGNASVVSTLSASQRRQYDSLSRTAQSLYLAFRKAGGSHAEGIKRAKADEGSVFETSPGKAQGALF